LRNGNRDCYTEISIGQVAQLVERSPEKAGVGGSIPSLATISNHHRFKNFQRSPAGPNAPFWSSNRPIPCGIQPKLTVERRYARM
jgi:hypothetical protein